MDKLTMTIPEAGRALGIGRSAAYEAARNHQLPTIRIGLLVPISALETLLKNVNSESATNDIHRNRR